MIELEIQRVDKVDNEQVVLKVLDDCNLWPYILFDTTYNEEGNVSNIHRHSFFFPNLNVLAGDYVVIRTGQGNDESFLNKAKTTTYILHWGFDDGVSLWNEEADRALLVKVSEYKFKTL